MTQKKILIYTTASFVFGLLLGGVTGYFSAQKMYTLKLETLKKEKIELEQELAPYRELVANEQAEQALLAGFDYEADDSLQKFVNSEVAYNDKKYEPETLVTIKSTFVTDAKGGSSKLRSEANDALQKLAEDFYENMGYKLEVVSAYRSYNYQKGIENGSCPRTMCARAGFSEHQSGLAFDIFSASNEATWKNSEKLQKVHAWMREHAHEYGFHQSYQRGPEVDGYEIEPWHWRYVGTDLAEYLLENDLTFAQFYTNYYEEKENTQTSKTENKKKNP